jgi:hypothetical protein
MTTPNLGIHVAVHLLYVLTEAISVVCFVFLDEGSGDDSSAGRLLVLGSVVGTIRPRDFSNATCRSSSVMLTRSRPGLIGQCC